jgi:hypothetical protein
MRNGPLEHSPAARFLWWNAMHALHLRREMHGATNTEKQPEACTPHAESQFVDIQLKIENQHQNGLLINHSLKPRH